MRICLAKIQANGRTLELFKVNKPGTRLHGRLHILIDGKDIGDVTYTKAGVGRITAKFIAGGFQ